MEEHTDTAGQRGGQHKTGRGPPVGASIYKFLVFKMAGPENPAGEKDGEEVDR